MYLVIISFVGAPGSGKTTLAFKLYAALKEHRVPCEFVQEQARLVIALRSLQQGLSPSQSPVLTDEDQLYIMQRQLDLQTMLVRACGPKVVVVTDSSPLNSLLHCVKQDLSFLEQRARNELASLTEQLGGITFYCAPVPLADTPDPNWIHDQEQARLVDSRVMPVLATYAPDVLGNLLRLDGDLEHRYQTLFLTVMGEVQG